MNLLKKSEKGFTLVELLIVIALLGALAVGLLLTIDPVEQIKKGQDTSLRNTANEFFQAESRYYTNKGAFTFAAATSAAVSGMSSDVAALIAAGELKPNFWSSAGQSTGSLTGIQVISVAGDDITVCMDPSSKGIQKDPATIYNASGVQQASGCKSQSATGGADCYICFK